MTHALDRSTAAQCDSSDDGDSFPLIEELRPAPPAHEVFLNVVDRPRALFLDSARRDGELGRFSFVAADPFDFLTELPGENDSLATLSRRLRAWPATTAPDLPPFQGGAAGLVSYDLGRQLEELPSPAYDEFRMPAVAVGFYDLVVAFDHAQDRAWIVSQGFPETEPSSRRRRAGERLAEMRRWLARLAGTVRPRERRGEAEPLGPAQLAPQHDVSDISHLTSNFSARQYLDTVARAIGYIHAGDVFQVNLAQRLLAPGPDDPVALYRRLRERNPAPFAAYFDLGDFHILSASPERFLRVRDGEVETRPIKGTRQRTARAEADLFAGDELRQSEKDRAENIMIVDLLRNDLSQVCATDSVRVEHLCRLETFQYVQHLVSVIRGRLNASAGAIDLLRAAFPGGSITGAPKIRAMEIIAELEPTARGAYCGTLGYVGFDGSADTSILIRTIIAGRGWSQAPVGGGIVAQSDPAREYEETWHKAAGLIRALVP